MDVAIKPYAIMLCKVWKASLKDCRRQIFRLKNCLLQAEFFDTFWWSCTSVHVRGSPAAILPFSDGRGRRAVWPIEKCKRTLLACALLQETGLPARVYGRFAHKDDLLQVSCRRQAFRLDPGSDLVVLRRVRVLLSIEIFIINKFTLIDIPWFCVERLDFTQCNKRIISSSLLLLFTSV